MKQDWSPRRGDVEPDLVRHELRRQLERKFGWSAAAVDDFFAFLAGGGSSEVGGSSTAFMLMDISKAFAATRKIYPLAQWRNR